MEKQIDKNRELISWLISFIIAFIVVYFCKQYLFSPVIVQGASMEPTYESKDIIIISKLSEIERFDQIVFKSPIEDENYIKRVIGLPGDTVEMKDDVLYINGEKFEEGYVNRESKLPILSHYTEDFKLEELTGEKSVPEGYVFVLGDNRLVSKDSRHFGFISMDEILGVSKVRIYPINHIKLF